MEYQFVCPFAECVHVPCGIFSSASCRIRSGNRPRFVRCPCENQRGKTGAFRPEVAIRLRPAESFARPRKFRLLYAEFRSLFLAKFRLLFAEFRPLFLAEFRLLYAEFRPLFLAEICLPEQKFVRACLWKYICTKQKFLRPSGVSLKNPYLQNPSLTNL